MQTRIAISCQKQWHQSNLVVSGQSNQMTCIAGVAAACLAHVAAASLPDFVSRLLTAAGSS